MRKVPILLVSLTLLLAACFLLACGSGHLLRSLTISPAVADGQSSSNGQVQFTPMGSYGGSSQPMAVNAIWWSFTPWTTPPPTAAPTPPTYSLTSDGVAACLGVGTFTLWATAPKDQTVPLSKMTKSTSQLTATAQLTCP